jgi:hypothetical protein
MNCVDGILSLEETNVLTMEQYTFVSQSSKFHPTLSEG